MLRYLFIYLFLLSYTLFADYHYVKYGSWYEIKNLHSSGDQYHTSKEHQVEGRIFYNDSFHRFVNRDPSTSGYYYSDIYDERKIGSTKPTCPDGTVANNVSDDYLICKEDPCANLSIPSQITVSYSDVPLPYLGDFFESQDCVDYIVANAIFPASCQPATNFDSNTQCTKTYLYGIETLCNDITPPPTYNNFPLAGKWTSQNLCEEAIYQFGDGTGGTCKQVFGCTKYFFGYFKRKDGSHPQSDPEHKNLPEDGPMPQQTDNRPSTTDDINDTVDLTPMLDQIAQSSDRQHTDTERLKNSVDLGFQGLHDDLTSLQGIVASTGNAITTASGSSSTEVDLSGVEQRLDVSNDHLTKIENNISGISGFFSSMGNLISDPSVIGDTLQASIEDIASKYIGQDVIDMPECGTVPTIGANVFGRDIVLISDDIVNSWPLDIFRTMIIFFFALSGVIITFRGS